MIYRRLTHITMIDDHISDIKTDGAVKVYRVNDRQSGAFRSGAFRIEEIDGTFIGQHLTMDTALIEFLQLAIPNNIMIEGTGRYAGLETRSLKRATYIALTKKLEIVE